MTYELVHYTCFGFETETVAKFYELENAIRESRYYGDDNDMEEGYYIISDIGEYYAATTSYRCRG